jgi:maltose-binding protein MalE
VERVALQLQGQGKVDVPFGLPVPDPYHEYPLFTALGGYVFGRNLDGTYDPQDLGLDGPQSLHAAEEFGRWRADGLIDPEVTVDVMIHAFTSGATPFAVTGPWVVLDPTQGFEASGVSFSVDPLPSVEGAAPRPLVRALGFAVPSSAADPEKAISFVLEVFTAPAAQAELAGAVDRPPAMTAALEGSSIDERLRGFGLAARDGDPLPAIPEMTEVWGPWADAYAKIFQQTAPPEQAFRDAAEAIRSAISGGVSPSPAPGD